MDLLDFLRFLLLLLRDEVGRRCEDEEGDFLHSTIFSFVITYSVISNSRFKILFLIVVGSIDIDDILIQMMYKLMDLSIKHVE